jgi:hypothetical protein
LKEYERKGYSIAVMKSRQKASVIGRKLLERMIHRRHKDLAKEATSIGQKLMEKMIHCSHKEPPKKQPLLTKIQLKRISIAPAFMPGVRMLNYFGL